MRRRGSRTGRFLRRRVISAIGFAMDVIGLVVEHQRKILYAIWVWAKGVAWGTYASFAVGWLYFTYVDPNPDRQKEMIAGAILLMWPGLFDKWKHHDPGQPRLELPPIEPMPDPQPTE